MQLLVIVRYCDISIATAAPSDSLSPLVPRHYNYAIINSVLFSAILDD